VFGVPWRRFAGTLIIARGLRYLFWGVLGIFYGDEALELLRSVDRGFSVWGLRVLGVIGVLTLAGLLAWRVRRRRRSQGGGGQG
jgi:membrane protein DedA with SNARE-associated domain